MANIHSCYEREDKKPTYTRDYVDRVADTYLQDNPDFSAEMRRKVREAQYASSSVEEFWKKLEENN